MPITRIARRIPQPPEPSAASPPADAAPAASPPAEAPVGPTVPVPVGIHADLITPTEAAERLSVKAAVLERWRGNGAGPAFVRMSSKTIRYRPADLDAFVAGRVRNSTAASSPPVGGGGVTSLKLSTAIARTGCRCTGTAVR